MKDWTAQVDPPKKPVRLKELMAQTDIPKEASLFKRKNSLS